MNNSFVLKSFWPAVVALFAVVHLTMDRVEKLTGRLAPGNAVTGDTVAGLFFNMPLIKFVAFASALTLLALPLAVSFCKAIDRSESLKRLGWSACVVGILAVLVWHLGNASMGQTYSEISLDPFAQHTSIYNRRLLMPGLAHLLFMGGYWPYYCFSLLLTAIFIALLQDWCIKNTSLKSWQILSVCTSSFVIFQFQFPGYPDILFYIMMLLVMGHDLDQRNRLTLLILSLVVHESSVFICSLLALRYLDKETRYQYFAAVGLYLAVFFAANDFDFHTVFGMHAVQSKSGLEWVLSQPWYEILGLGFAWKALWVVAAVAIFHALRARNYRDAWFIPAALGSGVLVTFLAVDTSRLAGFAFPGILLSLSIAGSIQNAAMQRFLSYLFLLNLIIPSAYVGLSTGFVVREGIYGFVFQALATSLRAVSW